MRRWTMTMVILSGILFLSGCVRTPEESLIRQKKALSLESVEKDGEAKGAEETAVGMKEEENGEEEETTENAGEGEQGGTGQKTGEEPGKSADGEEELGKLRETLNAPEHYQSEIRDKTGKLTVITDAEVEIPEVNKVPALRVSQRKMDQELIDQVTEAVLGEMVFYTYDDYFAKTKEECRKELEELKGYAAEGNLDPYGEGTDEDGNYDYDIYAAIEEAERAYQEAPEKTEHTKVEPRLSYTELHSVNDAGKTEQSGQFFGVAEAEDGSVYQYKIKSSPGMPTEFVISKEGDSRTEVDQEEWGHLGWMGVSQLDGTELLADEESLSRETGISLEKAVQTADEKVEKLALSDMEMTSWEYAVDWDGDGNQRDVAYLLHYTRKPDGIPITYTRNRGGSVEDMDSAAEAWGYEVLDIVISGDGIQQMELNNLYQMDDVETEEVSLLSFGAIIRIYEKMMLIQNADVITDSQEQTDRIDRISFGYTRIYEPSTDSTSGILVPVWDFFGREERMEEYDGETVKTEQNDQYQSFLTINAIDGSVIDRSLGY